LEYQKQHSNFILLEHTENKRQGAARNTGLKNAKGKYIWFIDNDDFIRENSIENMLLICTEKHLDILQFNYSSVIFSPPFLPENQTVTGISYLKKWIATGESVKYSSMFCVWTHLFRREFLLENNIYFREYQAILEDVAYLYRAFCFAERVQAIDEINYYFSENETSSSRTKLTAQKMFFGCFGITDDLLRLAEDIENKDKFIAENLCIADARYHISLVKLQFVRLSFGEQRKFLALLKENSQFVKNIIKRTSMLPIADKLCLQYTVLLYLTGYFGLIRRKLRKIFILK
jgi:glycosyltransferase involved in cell wall biosynthesis